MRLHNFRPFTPGTVQTPTRSRLIVPAFTLDLPQWTGASDFISEFAINNTEPFSLKLPITSFGVNFVLAIRWSSSGVAYRFKLWDDSRAVLYYPVYNGERIGVNAVLEVWSVNGGIPLLTSAQDLYTSVLNIISGCQTCCTNADISQTLTIADPTICDDSPFCAEGEDPEPEVPGGGILTVDELAAGAYGSYFITPWSSYGVPSMGELVYPNMIDGAEAAFWVTLYNNEWNALGIPYSDRVLGWYFINHDTNMYDFDTKYASGDTDPDGAGNSWTLLQAPWVLTYLWTP